MSGHAECFAVLLVLLLVTAIAALRAFLSNKKTAKELERLMAEVYGEFALGGWGPYRAGLIRRVADLEAKVSPPRRRKGDAKAGK